MVVAVELDSVVQLPLIATDDEVEMRLKSIPLHLADDTKPVERDDISDADLGVDRQAPAVSRSLDFAMSDFFVVFDEPQHFHSSLL